MAPQSAKPAAPRDGVKPKTNSQGYSPRSCRADRHKITLRTATFAVACERILSARQERGLYP